MAVELSPDARDVFEKGKLCFVDNGKVFGYGLKDVSVPMVEETCNEATVSYAKKVLGWPNGRLAKPDIFSPINERVFESLGDCIDHFIKHLQDLFKSSPKEMPVFPFAFITISKDKMPDNATLVLAHKSHGQWQLDHRSIPVQVELSIAIESLRMGDMTTKDILNQYACGGQAKLDPNDSDPRPSDKWAFAVFSTGLAAALPLLALIDSLTDEVQPSEATLDLISDPESRQYQMSWEKMKERFPLICRDDEHRVWRTNGMRLHKRVFICCDNDKPDRRGVLVMQMEWDGNTERGDKELKNIGEAAKVYETRVEVKEALGKAYEVAERLP